MDIKFPASRNFLDNLILQRTGDFLKLGGGLAFNQWAESGSKSQLSDFLIANNLLGSWLNETANSANNHADALVDCIGLCSFKNIVSIGPGNGLLELLIYKKTQFTSIYLIDIEYSDSHRHGFKLEGSGYANLEETKNFLISNDVPENKILLCNPSKQNLSEYKFDLLISILSMGFHYPCDSYVDFIVQNAKKGSKIVLDKRPTVIDDGFNSLLKFFRLHLSATNINQLVLEKID
jgi:hypothetical protein